MADYTKRYPTTQQGNTASLAFWDILARLPDYKKATLSLAILRAFLEPHKRGNESGQHE